MFKFSHVQLFDRKLATRNVVYVCNLEGCGSMHSRPTIDELVVEVKLHQGWCLEVMNAIHNHNLDDIPEFFLRKH